MSCPIKKMSLSSCLCPLIKHWVSFTVSSECFQTLCVLLLQYIMTHFTCLVPPPRTISYLYPPHFTCCTLRYSFSDWSKTKLTLCRFPVILVNLNECLALLLHPLSFLLTDLEVDGCQLCSIRCPSLLSAKIRPPLPTSHPTNHHHSC